MSSLEMEELSPPKPNRRHTFHRLSSSNSEAPLLAEDSKHRDDHKTQDAIAATDHAQLDPLLETPRSISKSNEEEADHEQDRNASSVTDCTCNAAYGAWKGLGRRWHRCRDWFRSITEPMSRKWNSFRLVKAFKRQFPGWQTSAVCAIVVGFTSFIINLSYTLYVALSKERGTFWAGTIKEGNCGEAELFNKRAHAMVNILSTLLLASSNYFMQLSAAPTRDDVDRAHRRREWCDIGIPTFRNSWRRTIRPWRTVAWICLAITSLPLHLLWNSAFFYTPLSYLYYPVIVNSEFPAFGALPDNLIVDNIVDAAGQLVPYPGDLAKMQVDLKNPDVFEYMDNEACIKTYANDFVYDRSDVVLVVEPLDLSQANASCPIASGHPYRSLTGDIYDIHCYMDFPQDSLDDLCGDAHVDNPCPWTSTIEECLDACSRFDGCQAATWVPNNCTLKPAVTSLKKMTQEAHIGVLNDSAVVGLSNTSVLTTVLYGWGAHPYRWICNRWELRDLAHLFNTSAVHCGQQALANPDDWQIMLSSDQLFVTVLPARVTECYSKLMPQLCKVEYSLWIGIIVTTCNFIKLMIFGIVFWTFRRSTALMARSEGKEADDLLFTTGDALVSFLRRPDEMSRSICMAEKQDFEHGLWHERWRRAGPMTWQPIPLRKWFRAIGVRRWLTSLSICLIVPAIILVLLSNQVSYWSTLGITFDIIRSLGMGQPNTLFVFGYWYDVSDGITIMPDITTAQDFYWAVIKANAPQLALSLAYVTYNNHLTCMLAAREYGRFAKNRHALRVSYRPEGEQKSRPFLSLPTKYAVAMMSASALIHYLLSQALFVSNVRVVDFDGNPTSFSLNQVGYSPLGFIVLAVVAISVSLLAWSQGFRRLPDGMPMAASCSASISAACHPSDRSANHHLAKVQWGVEVDAMGDPIKHECEPWNEMAGHCTFTSGWVIGPTEGDLYM